LGCERHLFAMNWLARHYRESLPGFEIPAIFTDPSYGKLTTSYLSTSNCGSLNVGIFGFGPVTETGLGLGYVIHDDSITVCITSFTGNAVIFSKYLNETIAEMNEVLEKNQPANL